LPRTQVTRAFPVRYSLLEFEFSTSILFSLGFFQGTSQGDPIPPFHPICSMDSQDQDHNNGGCSPSSVKQEPGEPEKG
jgi:hypothetical protein